MILKRTILIVSFTLLSFSAFSQKRLIRGIVVDSVTSKPLTNAHVIVFGTTSGTTTSATGSFEMEMNFRKSKVIMVSHVGYELQKVDASRATDLTIRLKPEVTDLSPINLAIEPTHFKTVETKPHPEGLVIVEAGATYPGSIDLFRASLRENLRRQFPVDWKSFLTISFTVDTSGALDDILVSDSSDLKPDRLRYILSKMPNWEPATQHQVPVAQKFQIEVFNQAAPEFKTSDHSGLYKFIEQNLHYPKDAVKEYTKGIVECSIRLNSDGTIRRVNIVRDIGNGCGDEVQRVVKMIPPEHTKHLLALTGFTSFRMPIYFYLDGFKPGAFDMGLDTDGATLILPGTSVSGRK